MENTGDNRDRNAGRESASIPVIEEKLEVGKRETATGRVVITKKVEEREQLVDEPLISEQYRVERIPINMTLDAPASIRHVGDTTIIPVMEEVAVVTKQLILREELHITRVRVENHKPERIRLRREAVEVERVQQPKGDPEAK